MFQAGEKLFVRTVTYHLLGEVADELPNGWLRLCRASWVADSGRFHVALQTGRLAEVEPVGDCWVNLASATDVFPWPHALPTEAS